MLSKFTTLLRFLVYFIEDPLYVLIWASAFVMCLGSKILKNYLWLIRCFKQLYLAQKVKCGTKIVFSPRIMTSYQNRSSWILSFEKCVVIKFLREHLLQQLILITSLCDSVSLAQKNLRNPISRFPFILFCFCITSFVIWNIN